MPHRQTLKNVMNYATTASYSSSQTLMCSRVTREYSPREPTAFEVDFSNSTGPQPIAPRKEYDSGGSGADWGDPLGCSCGFYISGKSLVKTVPNSQADSKPRRHYPQTLLSSSVLAEDF